MVGTRFRTLVKEPLRGHDLESSATKSHTKLPKPRKVRIWRSKKSAAMGDFWTKTDRGKSWKRWSAEKETFGAKWGYYLMSGTNIPYLNPEKFIERPGYRIIELRMKRSAIRDAVETKISETRTVRKTTAQEEKTENHTQEILGNGVNEDKNAHKEGIPQTNAKTSSSLGFPVICTAEPEEHQFTNDEFYTIGDVFENRGWVPSAISLKINPNAIDFTSDEITTHIGIQVVFGMDALSIDEEANTTPREQETATTRQVAASSSNETNSEKAEGSLFAKEKNAHQREKRARRMMGKRQKFSPKLKIRGETRRNKPRKQSAKKNREASKKYLDTKKPQKRNNSAALLRGGVRVGVIRNQQLRLASAGVSLPPEKS